MHGRPPHCSGSKGMRFVSFIIDKLIHFPKAAQAPPTCHSHLPITVVHVHPFPIPYVAPIWPRGAVQRPLGYVHSHYHYLRFLLHVHDSTPSLVDTSFKLGQPFGFSNPFQRGDPCSPTVLSPEGRRPAALATATTQLLLQLRKEIYKGQGEGGMEQSRRFARPIARTPPPEGRAWMSRYHP